MSMTKDDAIGGFNGMLADQRRENPDARMTVTLFDTGYTIVHSGKPIHEIPELTPDTYRPGGMTALLDAFGRTIDAVGSRLAKAPESERPDKVIFVLITDGMENSSREYTKTMVKDKVKHQEEKYAWQFIYLGANQDAITEGADMGILTAANYCGSGIGTRMAYMGASLAVSAMASGKQLTSADFSKMVEGEEQK